MKSTILIISIYSILLFSTGEKAAAQCCAAGNPVSSNCSVTSYGSDVLSVYLSHIYSLSDTYYRGTQKLDKEYIATEFNFSYIMLSYGLSDRMRIIADLGYFFNKTQNFVNQGYERYAQGLGDLNLGLGYDTYRSEGGEFSISQTARVTLPVGVFNQVYDGIELPIDLQPSSGNYKVNLGISFSNRFGSSGFSVFSVNSFEMAQFIKTSTSEYKYGNLYNLSLIGAYRVSDNISTLLQLRCEIRDKALNSSINQPNQYSYLNSTGGVIGFISPQVNYSFAKDWSLSVQFNYPFFKHVYGEQLTNKYSLQAGITKSFDFSGSEEAMEEQEEEAPPKVFDPKLLSESIHVEGKCEMCKARIEKIAGNFAMVEGADWNPDTKKLTLYYRDTKPDITAIQKALAAKGHDNDMFKAEDSVYNKLPSCCHYRDN